MPALTRNPDDELLRVIRSLESRVQALETRRSRPSVGGRAKIEYSQGFTPNVWDKLSFDSVDYDSGGVVDLDNDRLHAPSTGAYLVLIGSPYLYSTGTYVSMMIWVNGSPVFGGGAGNDDSVLPTINVPQAHLLRMNEGDYAEFMVSGDGGEVKSDSPFSVGIARLHDL